LYAQIVSVQRHGPQDKPPRFQTLPTAYKQGGYELTTLGMGQVGQQEAGATLFRGLVPLGAPLQLTLAACSLWLRTIADKLQVELR